MKFIDTHCHLNDEKFSEDLAEVFERAKICGVEEIINLQPKNGKAKAIKVSTLCKLCEALECQPGDLLEYKKG